MVCYFLSLCALLPFKFISLVFCAEVASSPVIVALGLALHHIHTASFLQSRAVQTFFKEGWSDNGKMPKGQRSLLTFDLTLKVIYKCTVWWQFYFQWHNNCHSLWARLTIANSCFFPRQMFSTIFLTQSLINSPSVKGLPGLALSTATW